MWREFRSEFLLYALARTVFALSWIAILRILTERMAPGMYGTYSLILAAITVFCLISTTWLATSLVRYYPQELANNRHAEFFSISFRASAMVTIASGVVFVPCVVALRSFGIVEYSNAALFSISTAYIGTCVYALVSAYCRATRAVGQYVLIIVSQVAIFLSFCFFVLGDSDDKIFSVFLFLTLSYLPILAVIRLRDWPIESADRVRTMYWIRKYLRFGLPLLFVAVSVQLNSTADQYLLRIFFDAESVGTYAANYIFAEKIVTALASLVALAGVPLVYRAWESEVPDRAYHMLWHLLIYFGAIAIPIVLLVMAYGRELAGFLVDDRYASGSAIIVYVTCGAIFAGFASILSDALTIHKRTMLLAKCYLSATLFNVIGNMFSIPAYGQIGAAACTFASYVFLVIIVAVNVQRITGLFTYAGGFRSTLSSVFHKRETM